MLGHESLGNDRAGEKLKVIRCVQQLMFCRARCIIVTGTGMTVGITMVGGQHRQRRFSGVFNFMGQPVRLKTPYAHVHHEDDEHRKRDGFSKGCAHDSNINVSFFGYVVD